MKTRDKISQEIIDYIKWYSGCDEVTELSDFNLDLGFDSLDFVEMIVVIESEFCIAIPEDDAELLTTVGKLVDYVFEKLK